MTDFEKFKEILTDAIELCKLDLVWKAYRNGYDSLDEDEKGLLQSFIDKWNLEKTYLNKKNITGRENGFNSIIEELSYLGNNAPDNIDDLVKSPYYVVSNGEYSQWAYYVTIDKELADNLTSLFKERGSLIDPKSEDADEYVKEAYQQFLIDNDYEDDEESVERFTDIQYEMIDSDINTFIEQGQNNETLWIYSHDVKDIAEYDPKAVDNTFSVFGIKAENKVYAVEGDGYAKLILLDPQ